MKNSPKSKVKRAPKRGSYDPNEIYRILDKHYLCHIGFLHNGAPIVIPTMFGRKNNTLFIHGASVSRLVNTLELGIDVSISVAEVNGLVLARSAFHHSLNYESVVLFGTGKLVDEHKKEMALKVISDHLIKQRWEEVRPPSQKELKATKVIQITIDEASAKVRTGGPIDDKKDYELDIWAGVIPIVTNYAQPEVDTNGVQHLSTPQSVLKLMR